MRQFRSIDTIDTAILYTLELASSLSVLLLAFGLIASMANVLTKGSVLSDSVFMQQVWAWTQCIAIDASVAGAIIRTCRYLSERSWVKFSLYAVLSSLLLFTAAIVSNIESVQQTLNITLDSAYTHVFIPVEGLIWVRSIAIVLLIVAHAMRHVQFKVTQQEHVLEQQQETTVISLDPQEEQQKQLPAPRGKKSDAFERVKAYVVDHPQAKGKEVAQALSLSIPTANKWLAKVHEGE